MGGGGINMPEILQRFISESDLGNPWEYLFHIAHTYPLGGVDVPELINFDLRKWPIIGHN